MSIRSRLHDFFFPPQQSSRWRRILPYASLGVLTFIVLLGFTYAWDYTNSPEFCGEVCHTMPPEFSAYLASPHARVDCVECHIGRGFITTRITRKAGDVRHIISLAFKTYEFPIRADEMRPARETCEKCHYPEKFSDDSLREIRHFQDDPNNTAVSTYLTLKTGGGTEREGLGRGIHWHIENEVYYLTQDVEEQSIPYVRVVEDGEIVDEYVELGSGLDSASIDESDLKRMDCITCHNRITHLILTPEDSLDQLMMRGLISPTIPEIHRMALEALSATYASKQEALSSIEALENWYASNYPEFAEANQETIDTAVSALRDYYNQSVFPEQKADWNTHSNNIGHQESPGCFRCHDGEHINQAQVAIRLECNLCHSIPVVAGPEDFTAEIEISRGPEPESHLHSSWINLHHDAFNDSCATCHTTDDPGGTSNTSFCSNSACHGNVFQYAGFDAPALREMLRDQFPEETEPTEISLEEGAATYNGTIGPIFEARCSACHSEGGMRGLNLTTYVTALEGSENGEVIVPGNPQASRILQILTAEQPHFAQLTAEELQLLTDWIADGAPEN